MSSQNDLKRLIINYQRRLQKLKEMQALQGINTAPETLIEIEDIEAELEKFQLALKALQDGTLALSPDSPLTSLDTAIIDRDNPELLSQQLLKVLKEDPAFAAELAVLLNLTPPAEPTPKTSNVTASGGGIAIGGNVGGSIVFGNNNTVIGNNPKTEKD